MSNKCQIPPYLPGRQAMSNTNNAKLGRSTFWRLNICHLTFIIPRLGGAGFTLVEIMVAIAIASLVFGFIISSISAIGRRARDQQRVTDLQNIQAALAQYYADQNFYPDSSLDLSATTQIAKGTKIYLDNLPKDPQGVLSYCYKPLISFSGDMFGGIVGCNNSANGPSCQYYRLCAQMETVPANASANCALPTVCGASYTQAVELNPYHSGGN